MVYTQVYLSRQLRGKVFLLVESLKTTHLIHFFFAHRGYSLPKTPVADHKLENVINESVV